MDTKGSDGLVFRVFFTGEKIGRADSIEEAQKIVHSHPRYRKTWYGKKGRATFRHPNSTDRIASREYFAIYDNGGYRWSIRPR